MYCTKCGIKNPDISSNCLACGARLHSNTTFYGCTLSHHNIPNYLLQSILITFFCCLPLGIIAIMTSRQVDEKLRYGDYSGAMKASKKAKNYCLISLPIGIIVGVLYFLAALILS